MHKRSDMTIICLVGGDQEIHTGEAGISEWIKSLNEAFTHWKIYISPRYKPLGVHVLSPGDKDAVHWFLEDKVDTRSSNYLEDAAAGVL